MFQTRQVALSTDWSESDLQRMRRLREIAHELGLRVHFAAGSGAGRDGEGPIGSGESVSATRRAKSTEDATATPSSTSRSVGTGW